MLIQNSMTPLGADRSPRNCCGTLIALLTAIAWVGLFSKATEASAKTEVELQAASVVAQQEALERISGSAHALDEEILEDFEYDDVERVLQLVPGVYVRSEDGFGLRPNIGIRGANAERSAKVTLMEDGVLFAPAPYAAPAAYFFPAMTRITGVEVYKGPAAVRFGPNTIGGAINLQTRQVPQDGYRGAIDLAVGDFWSAKTHAHLGYGTKRFGLLVEGVRLQSRGFKRLDGGGNTGFEKHDVMAKGQWRLGADRGWFQELEAKVGYADEISRETYLGLSDEDFERTPYRRYAASARDRMSWDRTQLQLRYTLSDDERFDLQLTAYRHDFARVWRKFNEFGSVVGSNVDTIATPDSVLRAPTAGNNALYYAVLTGQQDATASETIILGTNDRTYVSQGVQGVGHLHFDLGPTQNNTEIGLRFHHDAIERDHDAQGYVMTGGQLLPDERGRIATARNKAWVHALAAHMHHETRYQNWSFAPGLRFEHIRTHTRDSLEQDAGGASVRTQNTYNVLVGGGGVSYQWDSGVTALAGVHQGFSPVAPGQDAQVKAERSIHYEGGARARTEHVHGEVIGFVNDYSNLTGRCTFSNGCTDAQVGDQFNGGRVLVYGAEVSGGVTLAWRGVRIDADLNYTFTGSEFQTSFSSGFPQFGDVEAGDQLPYVPTHRGSASVSASRDQARLTTIANYTGTMRDQAGQGDIPQPERIDGYVVWDAVLAWLLTDNDEVYLKADNVFDEVAMASRRPFGARPIRPRTLFLGYRHNIGGEQ